MKEKVVFPMTEKERHPVDVAKKATPTIQEALQ